MFESVAEQKNIQLKFTYHAAEDLQILMDVQKLEIICNNLLSNALKFTGQNGIVELFFQKNIEHLTIIVKDNGLGIPKEDLSKIFNRYYQSRQKHLEGGTGIGLALSQELIKLMKGTIKASSELKKGSSFQVDIPIHERLVHHPSSTVEVAITSPKTEKASLVTTDIYNTYNAQEKNITSTSTILIVEDNVAVQEYLQILLEPLYSITIVSNGHQALNHLNQSETQPDLIISDVMMPIMDGYQLMNILKKDKRFYKIPTIVLTARASDKNRLAMLRIGVDDYLTKPFLKEELLIRINNLLLNAIARKTTKAKNIEPIKYNESTSTTPSLDWLMELETYITEQLSEPTFSVAAIAAHFNMSRYMLNRRLKSEVGVTPSEYIQNIRLTHARELLQTKQVSLVKAAAAAVGISDVKAFSRKFKQRFGRSPSEYL